MHAIQAKTILSAQNGMNIYRGCTHGCIYCDSRSSCYQMEHPFEDIAVKSNAPELLEQTLRHKRQKCMIGTGSMSDPYLPEEADLRLTRRCLELIARYGFGLSILTKSDLILRDLELLQRIQRQAKCVVQMTLTTYDENLCRILEPNVCTTKRRAEVLNILHDAGIPTICWLTPILPFINDNEKNIRGLLGYCQDAGVRGIIQFGIGVTLRDGDRQHFYQKLDQHFPGLKAKYIKTYGNAYMLPSPQQKKLLTIIADVCSKAGIQYNADQLFTYMRTFEDKTAAAQLTLF